ncbi:hypothetical protein AB0D59_01330 [Streptomyces sp. NPDC048417]|uniref:hypothetical protein n=1 Tax=Streptomyces sp. NPDC048417 TaxID=3155387 RepID=UPI0034445611
MPRVTLAHWHGGQAPGTEIEISDEELAHLRRDGRVAEAPEPATEPSPAEQQDQAAKPEPSHEAAPDAPAPRTRKR